MFKNWLLSNVFTMRAAMAHEINPLLCSADGDAPAGGDGGAAAAAEGAKPVGSILSNAKDAAAGDAGAAKDQPAAGAEGAKAEGEGEPAAETPEAKAERLKNETPEAKAAREAEEKAVADKKVADTLKTYDAVKLPKGITKDNPALADFLQAAAKDGLPLERAQSYVDSVAPKLQAAVDAPYKAWADLNEKWIGELKSDSVIGGAALEANLGLCAKAIDTYAGKADTPEGKAVRDALEFTGAGNNPAVARMLYRAGKALSEGAPLGGNVKTETDLAKSMYPSMPG